MKLQINQEKTINLFWTAISKAVNLQLNSNYALSFTRDMQIEDF